MGQTETLDHRIGIGQGAQQQGKERIDNQKAQDCQQQPNPRASHDTPANILNAAARVPGAPAHLSLQSAFPSLADRAFLLLRPPWMPSVGDHATAGKVAESRGVQAAPPSMARPSTLRWITPAEYRSARQQMRLRHCTMRSLLRASAVDQRRP